MGSVYDEFEELLGAWQRQYAGRPQREIIRLLLLALEREEMVSIGYREDLILRRLKSMPIADDVREIIRHALIWVWKDEQMHAIYIRGAIFKLGSPRLRAIAFTRQVAGATGGWAASVRQHVPWRDGPISRTLATALTWSGFALRQVPKDVLEHLDYRPFREYCKFNVDAEETAWLCFKRLVELVTDPVRADDFRRTQEDEERHRRVFEILVAAIDERDCLASTETADTLAQQIGDVGQVFLPRARRGSAGAYNPLGSGGPVWVLHGKSSQEKLALFHNLLDEAGLKERIEERARSLGKPVAELRLAIKPTFMLGYHRKDKSAITDPALVEELAVFLHGLGCSDVAVVEARNIYDKFFKNRAVHDVARYFDIGSPSFRLVDSSDEQIPHDYIRGLGQYAVGRTWKEADFRISFSKMRSHPVEMVYLTVGNLEGLGARCEEFLFVERQAHRETANMMLIDEFPPHFAIIDAYDLAADGLLGVMGCPHPKSPHRFYAGVDAISVDMVAARHLGIGNPRDSQHLNAACHWFGDPSANIQVIGIDEPVEGWRGPYYSEWSALLSLLAYPVYQYASNRGALFVPEMDRDAFPPISPEKWFLRARRRSLQALLGLRHKR
ncbi:MAG TPA: DUF362 domain-containing protein [Blastocatellia bacterium]|nr:DUF362 domain-containing protein [Blastocatellia bacterium]